MSGLLRLGRGLALLYLYYPHIALLRALGPHRALAISRALALVHAHASGGTVRRIGDNMRRTLARRRPELDIRHQVRLWLRLQHQHFVEWNLYPTRRGRRFARRSYRLEGREHLDAALAGGRGALAQVFHFGMAAALWGALREHGYTAHRHVFRGAHYAGSTPAPIARALLARAVAIEQSSELPAIYHRPFYTFAKIIKLLARGTLVGINGDGMMGTEFARVPFLDGDIVLPAGPALLSARSGAPLVPIYCLPVGPEEHVLTIHPAIRPAGEDRGAIAACMRAYVAVFERYVEAQPWAWWTWDRLQIDDREDGGPSLRARALSTAAGSYHFSPAGSR